MNAKIISEFSTLIDKAKSDRDKGWQHKVRNYKKVVSILKDSSIEIENTEGALSILREGGMKLVGEKPPTWKSKILVKIEKIITNGSLNIEVDEKTTIIKMLTSIPEIGESKALQLYESGIKKIEDLTPNLINRKQQIGLRHYQDLAEKIPRKEMDQWLKLLRKIVNNIGGVLTLELAGSYRRGLSVSGDIDCYISVESMSGNLMEKIESALIEGGYMDDQDVFSRGPKKLMGVARLDSDKKSRHLDIFIYTKREYPFAILYATGSAQFNVNMRNYALRNGYSLSDKALRYDSNDGDEVEVELIMKLLGKEYIETEEDVFLILGVNYVEPCDRSANIKF